MSREIRMKTVELNIEKKEQRKRPNEKKIIHIPELAQSFLEVINFLEKMF
jgi:hypothetical protein